MQRTPINPHAFDEVKLREDVNQKIIDRFSAYQTDTRQRVDTLIKSIFVISGGALTISIGVFLRREAPQLTEIMTEHLRHSWYLLFYTLAAAATVLFIMILQGYIVGVLWTDAQRSGRNEIEKNFLLKASRVLNWSFGVTGFISFLSGVALLAYVSVGAISMSYQSAVKKGGEEMPRSSAASPTAKPK